MRPLRIGTRKSPLAIWQAEHVQALLAARGTTAELVRISTAGDRILDRALSLVGGKGLFVKELEEALADGRIDLAVHSAKDVPFAIPGGFTLCAFPAREDPRDALIAPRARRFSALPHGARVGTSSLRRAVQLLAQRPDLEIVPVRGNVQTRLGLASTLDAVVLALAGLRRLGLEEHVTEILPVELSLPSAGQGALAIEVLQGSPGALAATPLDVASVSRCVRAERGVQRRLMGSCTVPLGAYAVEEDGHIWLRAVLGEGGTLLRAAGRGLDPEELGGWVGDLLLAQLGKPALKAVPAVAP